MLSCSTAYESAIYAQVRQIDARMTFTYQGISYVYDNNYITQLTITEEVDIINDSLPSNELQITLDNTSRVFDFLNRYNINQIIARRPTMFVEMGLHTSNGVEWQPMGLFYVDDWKNDWGALTVTFVGHDCFMMMDNVSYSYSGSIDLYSLAQAVLIKAGIQNYSIDSSLRNMNTSVGFPQNLTCRQALQHIGIAAQVAVYQDRNGTINIAPFTTIDKNDNYMFYPGSDQGLYPSFNQMDSNMYTKISDGNGMKRLDFNNNYTIPQVSLERSINQVVVKVYSNATTSTDYIVNNSTVNGSNGQSFTIDNPLINDNTTASNVANWYIAQSNHNVVYQSTWRGNPIIEATDVVIVSNGLNDDFARQARIFRQEFQYQGYLTCITESRGGL